MITRLRVFPVIAGMVLAFSAWAQPQSAGSGIAGPGPEPTQGSAKLSASPAVAAVPVVTAKPANTTTTATTATTTTTPPFIPPAARPAEAGPTWKELTPAQQASLKPLQANWGGIGEAQKRKWLAVSKNYPALPAPEQAKLHSRMTEWASLSQQQRAQARLNFAETKKLSPGDTSANLQNWQAYQALSPEDKQKLAAKASPAPVGAAIAVKPVAPQKLATVPAARTDTKLANSGAMGTQGNSVVDRNTLLPRPASADQPAVQRN